MKIPRKLSVHHDQHNSKVLVTIHDVTASVTLALTPEEAEMIGDVGTMARAYREQDGEG